MVCELLKDRDLAGVPLHVLQHLLRPSSVQGLQGKGSGVPWVLGLVCCLVWDVGEARRSQGFPPTFPFYFILTIICNLRHRGLRT